MQRVAVRLGPFVLAVLLAACSSSVVPTPIILSGLYGGWMTLSGVPGVGIVFAVEVQTDSSGALSGSGTLDFGPTGTDYVYVGVSGATSPSAITLRLTDLVGDALILQGRRDTTDPRIFVGSWRTSFDGSSGTFRLTDENHIDALAVGDALAMGRTPIDLAGLATQREGSLRLRELLRLHEPDRER